VTGGVFGGCRKFEIYDDVGGGSVVGVRESGGGWGGSWSDGPNVLVDKSGDQSVVGLKGGAKG
jgi:hypothetical protein